MTIASIRLVPTRDRVEACFSVHPESMSFSRSTLKTAWIARPSAHRETYLRWVGAEELILG